MNSFQKKLTTWITTHKVEAFCLFGILLLASILRLYRISEYMTFLGDEGRDAIIVRNIFVKLHPPLIGPGTSIGNMYLGPLYYYISAPFSLLFGFSPVGPSVMVAFFGIATVFLVWKIGKEWFGNIAGLVAAFLYAISPVVIIYNRSSWNPNIMPFFSTLCIYSIWRMWHNKEFKWLIVFGISFAVVMQSHYLGLILAPIAGLFWLLTVLSIRKDKKQIVTIRKFTIISLVAFLVLMSPLFFFDIRHNWINSKAILTFFTDRQDTVSAKPWASFSKIWPLWEQISTRLLGGMDTTAGHWVAFGLFDGTLALLIMKWWRKKKIPRAYWLLLTWIIVSLFGLAAYKHELYDHYFGFLFTAPFLLLGGVTQDVIDTLENKKQRTKNIIYSLLFISFCLLLIPNIANSPLQYPPNGQLQRSIAVSQKIEEEAHGQKLNLAVIAERNYEGAYEYFLEKDNIASLKIDAQDTANTITDQLFVVCELPEEKCDPTHNPKTEVANFGWSEIDQMWNVDGVILYKLIHTEPTN